MKHWRIRANFEGLGKMKKEKISKTLDAWHKAAAEANFETYFGLMTEDGVFLGTDATENWQNKEFRAFLNLILIRVRHGVLPRLKEIFT